MICAPAPGAKVSMPWPESPCNTSRAVIVNEGRQMNMRLVFAGILTTWLLVLGCQRQSDPTTTLPTYSLRLANRVTGEPIVGARIRPYCGIPGDTNDWRTDVQGLVNFRSWFANGG